MGTTVYFTVFYQQSLLRLKPLFSKSVLAKIKHNSNVTDDKTISLTLRVQYRTYSVREQLSDSKSFPTPS